MRDGDHKLLGRYDKLFGASRVIVLDVSADVIDRATELRARHGFKSPDAIHLATALEVRRGKQKPAVVELSKATDAPGEPMSK